jgi:hypothetical protein
VVLRAWPRSTSANSTWLNLIGNCVGQQLRCEIIEGLQFRDRIGSSTLDPNLFAFFSDDRAIRGKLPARYGESSFRLIGLSSFVLGLSPLGLALWSILLY